MKVKILNGKQYTGLKETIGKTVEAIYQDERFYILGSELINAGASLNLFKEDFKYQFKGEYLKIIDLKSILRNFYRVKTKDGNMRIVLKDIDTLSYGNQDFIFSGSDGFLCCDRYNDDLTHKYDDSFDIIEIYKYSSTTDLFKLDSFGRLIYKVQKRKTMTIDDVEKELGYEIFLNIDGENENWDFI